MPFLHFAVRGLCLAITVRVHELAGRELRAACRRRETYSLTEDLTTLVIVDNSSDFLWCRIRLDDLELALQPLLVFLAVLLLDTLVVLDRLDELLLHQARLLPADLAVTPCTG